MSTKLARAPRRTKSFWIEHIKRWNRSSLSKADYCREHGLNAGSFYYWCSTKSPRVDGAKAKESPNTTTLLPVTVTDSHGGALSAGTGLAATVSLQNTVGRFSFPANLSSEAIARWLRAIGPSHV